MFFLLKELKFNMPISLDFLTNLKYNFYRITTFERRNMNSRKLMYIAIVVMCVIAVVLAIYLQSGKQPSSNRNTTNNVKTEESQETLKKEFDQMFNNVVELNDYDTSNIKKLPQGGQAALLRLWFFCFGFRPTIKPSNAGFDFFQQFVVGGDLPVYFSLVCADTALFHLAGGWPQMDRGDLINALPLVAAVVYQGGMTGGLQCPVGAGRPCRPPNLHIPFVVPVGGVLPVVLPAAFPVRDTLAVFVQVVCLAALCAPCAIFFQGPDGQHDMNMGVAGSLVVDGKIGAHPLVHKILLHIGPDKGKLLFPG